MATRSVEVRKYGEGGEMMKVKDLTRMAIVAALYCVVTWLVSPIAYGPMQFRLSEVMKPLALKGRIYIAGLSVGLLLANLLSPFGGPWEWVWMPVMCFIGGEIAYRMRKWPAASMVFYSAWISFAVAIMLQAVLQIPFYLTIGWIWIPELILMQIGLPLMNKLKGWL